MKFIKIKEVKPVNTEPVYHLTVEKNHNFFANNLCVHNCDYRGEILIILINHGDNFTISHGDRIAQGVIMTSMASVINLNEVGKISVTERGDGKFGSTGIK
jgi:dUTPase